MEDEAFPSEEVSQSLANSHSLTNRPSHSSRNSSDTNPRCSILTLLVPDSEQPVELLHEMATPLNVNEQLQLDDGIEKSEGSYFRSLVIFCRNDFKVMHRPSKHHLGAAKRILRYVAGLQDLDYAITWSSKKQSTTVLSSSEAEYVAAASSTCQVL
uniref:Reverse transcriptase Ty1/copia-type domain-containing protein n=1 Tax=Solanum lycopersicum TaxID=4081 RepID=A0A3Q7JWK4_SOLLC